MITPLSNEGLAALPVGKVISRDMRIMTQAKGDYMCRTADGWCVGSETALVRAYANVVYQDAAKARRKAYDAWQAASGADWVPALEAFCEADNACNAAAEAGRKIA